MLICFQILQEIAIMMIYRRQRPGIASRLLRMHTLRQRLHSGKRPKGRVGDPQEEAGCWASNSAIRLKSLGGTDLDGVIGAMART